MQYLNSMMFILILAFASNSIAGDFVPKYSLDECVVKVDLLWPEDVNYSLKYEVSEKSINLWNRVVASGKYPIFSQHSTSSMDYFVMYFAEQCENRIELAKTIITNELQSKVSVFPEFEVTTEFQIGFDGVMPSGMWLKK